MNWLDIVILVLFGVLVYAGYSQGIIKSILSMAILILSFILASAISPLICGKLISNEEFMISFTSIIEEKLNIYENLDEKISAVEQDNNVLNQSGQKNKPLKEQESFNGKGFSEKQLDDIMKLLEKELNLPSSVMKKAKKEIAKLGFFDQASTEHQGDSSALKGQENPQGVLTYTKGQAVTQMSDIISRSVAQMIIQGLCFTVLYFLIYGVLKVVSTMLDLISRFPVIKEVNKLAGAGLGFIEGILIIWVVGTLLFSLVNVFSWEELGVAMKGSLFMRIFKNF